MGKAGNPLNPFKQDASGTFCLPRPQSGAPRRGATGCRDAERKSPPGHGQMHTARLADTQRQGEDPVGSTALLRVPWEPGSLEGAVASGR